VKARTGSATAVGILLVGVAIAVAWLLVAPGIFGSSTQVSASGAAGATSDGASAAGLDAGLRILGGFQASQPRDPFRPLIEETTTTAVPPTTQPGETTTTIPGQTTTTVPGTTTTTGGFEPGVTVTLKSIQDVNGVLRAVVSVNGVDYTVEEGDTFASNFRVVSLDATSGVFLYLDNAFSLSVGQEILK
jgi:hypothetical protein